MFQFSAGESIQVVNPPEHCIYLIGYTGTIVKQVNEERYLVRLDPRNGGIARGRFQLYYLPLQALEKRGSRHLLSLRHRRPE
jgi:hypothetical protein